jgi:FtsP/CotA-like multicopper oxidase with cupredoxin domain
VFLIDGGGAFHVDRRQFLLLAGIGVATVAAGCQSTSSSTATLETPPHPEPDLFVSKDGMLNAAVNVTREPIDIGDQKVLATVYNGKFLGPTLRLRPGERLEQAVTNCLPEITNVHFHGMHVSPSSTSDNVFLRRNSLVVGANDSPCSDVGKVTRCEFVVSVVMKDD